MPRLFVAVEVPTSVAADVGAAVEVLREQAPALRWVDPERYHLTLVFLGSVGDSQVDAVRAAAGSVAAASAAVPLELTGRLGTFRSGVLWAELAPAPDLTAMAGALAAVLGKLVPLRDDDRPYRAHLTLARAPRGGRVPRSLSGPGVPSASWTVDRLVLMESKLSSAGATYLVDSAWDLRRAGSS